MAKYDKEKKLTFSTPNHLNAGLFFARSVMELTKIKTEYEQKNTLIHTDTDWRSA